MDEISEFHPVCQADANDGFDDESGLPGMVYLTSVEVRKQGPELQKIASLATTVNLISVIKVYTYAPTWTVRLYPPCNVRSSVHGEAITRYVSKVSGPALR